MTEQQRPPGETGGTTAPDVTRPAVPQQAPAPVEEALAPAEEKVVPPEEVVEKSRRRLRRRREPRRQSAFRRWRKTRPFWGGLLTMLGGVEIAAITAASYELLFVSKSVGFAIAVGAAIAVFGLTMWMSPVLSKLLGLLTLVAALLSFVTSNLGGFLLGMLLAILGGGLSFAWEPGRAVEPEPAEGPAAVRGQRPPPVTEEFEPLDHLLED